LVQGRLKQLQLVLVVQRRTQVLKMEKLAIIQHFQLSHLAVAVAVVVALEKMVAQAVVVKEVVLLVLLAVRATLVVLLRQKEIMVLLE
jgi:hypothetical protein